MAEASEWHLTDRVNMDVTTKTDSEAAMEIGMSLPIDIYAHG